MKNKIYSTKEFAKALGISKNHLLKLEAEGKVPPAKRIPRGKVQHRYYTVEDIAEFRRILGMPPLVEKQRIQLFLNFKGGTGKSTLAASYAYGLAELGLQVLAIDLDAQQHMTKCLGFETTQDTLSLFEVLAEEEDINKAVYPTEMPTLDVIPGNLRLSVIEARLLNKDGREFLLRRALGTLHKYYDVIVIDALPSITLLNKNAVLAANDLLVPVLPDYLSYDGLHLLFHEISRMQKSFAYFLAEGTLFDNIYIFINQYQQHHSMSRKNRQSLEENYSEYLCKTIIPYNTRIAQATATGMPIFQYDQSCKGAKKIRELIDEVFGFGNNRKSKNREEE